MATILAGLCVLVLIAGIALGLWLRDRTDEVEQTEQDRAEVVSAAQRFTVTWNTIDPKVAQQYVDQIRRLVTDNFFDKAFDGKDEQAVKLISKGGVVSDAKVLVNGDGIPLVGVSTLDPNSAVVMVVADSNRRVNGQAVVRHWRWQLELVKQGGNWLVDELAPI